MLQFVKLISQLPGILLGKRRLIHDGDAVWERRVGHRVLDIDNRQLHPRAQGYMDFARKVRLPREQWTVASMRASYETGTRWFGGVIRDMNIAEQTVTLGGEELTIRRYSPYTTDAEAPVILFFHGGGFVIGSLNTHDRFCRNLCDELAVEVIALDYRLAPEHRLPAAIHDAEALWDAIVQGDMFPGVQPENVLLCGDSAGAVLAMAVCEYAATTVPRVQPRGAVLIYPAVSLEGDTPSRASMGAAEIVLNTELMEWFFEYSVDPNAEPLPSGTELSLADFPPTLVITCGFDPLRDEGQHFVDAGNNAGATMQHKEYPRMFHGFITMAGLFSEADEVVEDIKQFVAGCPRSAQASDREVRD